MADATREQSVTAPKIVSLSATELFQSSSKDDKFLAHNLARAAWHGTRIILRQVSPESEPIFDFIIELCRYCNGDWSTISRQSGVSATDLQRFLEYSAVFLGNIGNYYGHGDQKFVPNVPTETIERLSVVSERARLHYDKLQSQVSEIPPFVLGFPSETAQSAYYISSGTLTASEVTTVTKLVDKASIHPENTRIRKATVNDRNIYSVLQASVEEDSSPIVVDDDSSRDIHLIRGDHSPQLHKICQALSDAIPFITNETQRQYISEIQQSFAMGDMEIYKTSQRTWLKHETPSIETIFGFVEPYRDPLGIRAEFEGVVGLVHKDESQLLAKLIADADRFITRLPWAKCGASPGSTGCGPFEAPSMEGRNFYSLHTIAYCSTIIFPGINLPNYNDIRQDTGSKNVMITNSIDGSTMAGDVTTITVDDSEADQFKAHRKDAYYFWVVFHELFGHGTGRFLSESEPGKFNFDIQRPPVNPLTDEPIDSWYKPGETWTSLFSDIATTVDECRAECVGAYLMSDTELLQVCGFTDETEITPSDLEYNMYLQVAVAGLRSLENYSEIEKKWGQAHSRGHFAMLQQLLNAGNDFVKIESTESKNQLIVRVDHEKIQSIGKPALEQLLMQLHIYRCTGDVRRCRTLFEQLTEPGPVALEWRHIVMSQRATKRIFVQPNTFIVGEDVVLKDYEPTPEDYQRRRNYETTHDEILGDSND